MRLYICHLIYKAKNFYAPDLNNFSCGGIVYKFLFLVSSLCTVIEVIEEHHEGPADLSVFQLQTGSTVKPSDQLRWTLEPEEFVGDWRCVNRKEVGVLVWAINMPPRLSASLKGGIWTLIDGKLLLLKATE